MAAWAALPLIGIGFDRALLDAAQFRPLFLGKFGVYQAALLILIGACMVAYAAIWRVGAAETIASMFAVAAGALIALLALKLEFNTGDVIAVFNPLEKMLSFTDASTADLANGASLKGIVLPLLEGIASVLARYTFVLHSSPRPTVFLVWLIVPGIALAWRRGERQTAIQALVLLLAAIGIDALGVRRGLKSEYFVFTDPLIILAGAILLDRMRDLSVSQMGVSDRRHAGRPAPRHRSGRAGEIRAQARRPGTGLRMEQVSPSAAAAAMVQTGGVITAC